ncbi:MAG TPA: glycosyltransferase 87 family protein, partial [Polyangiaceae bacterium]
VRFTLPRAGNHVWVFCAGIILLSSALRWGLMLLQGAPLVLGMLCFFIVAVNGNRPGWATTLAILAVAVKMTLSLPFLGILLLRRRFLAVFAAGATWLSLNALGFARMGHGAFTDYRANVGGLESFGNINAPDPWNPLSLPRLDWTSLFFGLSGNLGVAKVASFGLTGLVVLWLLREGLIARDPMSVRSTALFLSPLVCLGSLCVYHHQYDAALFFAPALFSAFALGPELRPRWTVYLALPLLAMILVLPIGLAQNIIASSFLGWRGVGLLKLSFPVAFSLALLGSLIALSRMGSKRGATEPTR